MNENLTCFLLKSEDPFFQVNISLPITSLIPHNNNQIDSLKNVHFEL